MNIIKWMCFIVVCLDVVGYILEKADEGFDVVGLIGVLIGIAIRVYVLYNTATYWLLA
jgi:hypothetical protein